MTEEKIYAAVLAGCAHLKELDIPPAVAYLPFSCRLDVKHLFGVSVVYHMRPVVRIESAPEFGRFREIELT